MSFGPLEILVVLFILAMIIGPSRISRMARSLGRGAYDFIDEIGNDKKDEKNEPSGEIESSEEKDKNHRK